MVLHDLSVTHTKSTFPLSLGAKVSGVDDATFSSTGEAYSTIVLPNCDSNAVKKLQADDVSLGARCFTCLVLAFPTLTAFLLFAQPMSSAKNSRKRSLRNYFAHFTN
jgi:hypothetical protein